MMLQPMGELSQLREQMKRFASKDPRYEEGAEFAMLGTILRKIAAILTGVAAYLVTYGLLLTFGLLAMLALAIGFVTLPSASELLGTSASSSSSYSVTPTPRASSASTSKTTSAAPVKSAGEQTSDALRIAIRFIAVGAGFLSLSPAWFIGSLAWKHYQQ